MMRLFLGALLLTLTCLSPVAAKTLTFDPEKCHITIPDDWKQQDKPGDKVAAISPDGTRMAVLRLFPIGPNLMIDNPGFADGLEKNFSDNGSTVTNRSQGTFAGLESRVWDTTAPTSGGTVYTHVTVVMANGLAYMIISQKLHENPLQDDQLTSIVQSFGFIGTPEPQKPAPPQVSRKKIALIVGACVLGVAAVIAGIVWIIRSRRREY